MDRKLLFVQGPEKTGTSTITGILNCHPEIFILFENYLGQPILTKYGNQLLERYPEARRFFRSSADYGEPVEEFFNFLSEQEPAFSYKYVGTKVNSLDPKFTQKGGNHKIIFMKRDLKTWLLKESVVKRYRTDLDIVVPAMEYLRYIVQSYLIKNSYHLWMEDLIQKNDESLSRISGYLELNLEQHTKKWWEKFGRHDKQDPKSVFRLGHVHHSSKLKPEKLDTSYRVINHSFWHDVDEIFNTYYQKRDSAPIIDKHQISQDLTRIENLKKYSPLTVHDCYSEAISVRFGFKDAREIHIVSDKTASGRKRSILSKIIKRLKRIKNAAFGKDGIDSRLLIPITFYDETRVAFEMIYIYFNQNLFF